MRLEIKYGLYIGIATIIYVFFEFYLSSVLNRPDLGTYTGAIAILIPIIGLIYGLKEKKKTLHGTLTFKQAVKSGFYISLVAALLNAVFVFIYISLKPDVMQNYFDYLRETMQENGASEEDISAQLELVQKTFTPGIQALYFFVSTTVVGTIISGLIGIFYRNKKTTEVSQ